MAAKKKAAAKAAGGAVTAARTSPYVQRIVQDEELRENVRDALVSARDAFDRLNNGKAPHKALLEDKKLQKHLQDAASSLKDAGEALREGPKKKRKRRGFGSLLLVTIVAAALAIGLSEDLRNKVLDALFGKEEEFEYTSTTSPSQPAPSGTAA